MELAQTIAERFEIEQLAGKGGMGKVYKARDRHSSEVVAVKVLTCDGLESGRFERECAVLAELQNPGIVRYVAHGRTAEGEPYLAMEWLEGEDLARRLKRAALTLEEALSLGQKVGLALQAAHARGVVHRDIKPANLFLCGGSVENVKVIDFGIARTAASNRTLTRTGVMIGTPGYFSPEQARGDRQIDSRADVFSLGCVLWRALAGRPPFEAEDVLAVLLRLTVEETPRVRSLCPDVPAELDALIARMMAKSPGERPRDGAEVAAALAALSAPSAAAPSSPARPAAVTAAEQRILCVLLARAAGDEATPADVPADQESAEVDLAAVAEHHGGRLHVLSDGSMFVTLAGQDPPATSVATDQAVRAARCALAFQALLPGAAMVLVAGRTVLSGCIPAGDAIDRGLRMLERAAGHAVAIDSVMVGLLDGRFDVRKGEDGTYLHGEHDVLDARRTLLGRPTVCVGRDAEIARLASYFEECVAEPMARAVVLSAPAGAGKSRLCQELLRVVRRLRPSVEVWVGRGDLMGAGSPFALLASAIRRTCGAKSGEPPEERRRKLLARVGRYVSGPDLAQIVELSGSIAGVPSADLADRRVLRGDLQVRADQLRRAWLVWLRAETAAAPLVIVLEDLHWGDLPSVSFIDLALRELSDRPLFVLALARPEVHSAFPKLWEDRAVAEVKLSALSRRASAQLIRRMLGEDTESAVVDAMVARADGNAFYLEELIRAAAEGLVQAPPETVLAMVQSRLDRLAPPARRVLRAASIFGEIFWKGGVRSLLGDDEAGALDDHLGHLTALELIERRHPPRFGGEEEYRFRHALVRDAAYAMLAEGDRARGHAAAGAFLERLGEEDELALAEHFERGGEPRTALAWYQRAAEKDLRAGHFEGAIARAEQAIACGAAGEARGALRFMQAEAHTWQNELLAADRCGKEALSLLLRGGALWCHSAGLMLSLQMLLGRSEELGVLAREIAEVEPAPDAISPYVAGLSFVVAALSYSGQYWLARTAGDRLEKLARRAGSLDPVARGWLNWARCHTVKCGSGDPWRHFEMAGKSVEGLPEAVDPRGSILALIELGAALRNLGRRLEAEEVLRDARARAQRLGAHFFSARAEGFLGIVLLDADRLEEARSVLESAHDTYLRGHNGMFAAEIRCYLARIFLRSGDAEGARILAESSVAMLQALPGRAVALTTLALVHLARGSLEQAREAARGAMSILQKLGGLPDSDALVRLVHAEVLDAAGERAAAVDALRAARARLFERATSIRDAAARRSFLENVEANRRTVTLAHEWGIAEGS